MKKLFLLGKSVLFFFLKSRKLNQMLWDAVKSDDLETAYVVLKAGANVYDFHTSRWSDPEDPDGICTIEKKIYPLDCVKSEEMKKLLNYFKRTSGICKTRCQCSSEHMNCQVFF